VIWSTIPKKSHVAEGVSIFWGGSMGKTLSIGLVCLTLAVAALAQVTTGRIEGTVTDPQGGVVPGAQIKVVNKLTGQSFESITNETGFWVLPSMSTAAYTVTVSLAGFKAVTIDNVKVDAGVPATVNAKLEVGAVTDEVAVETGAEVLQTETATLTSTLVGQAAPRPACRAVPLFTDCRKAL
jgi:hypothetical protein